MSEIMDLATARAVKPTVGPVQYAALRDVVTHDDHGRLQLAARVSDREPITLNARTGVTLDGYGAGDLVSAVNEINERAHDLRAEQRDADDLLASALDDDDATDDSRATAQEVHAQVSERIKGALKALPKINAYVTSPVAGALKLYGAQDVERERERVAQVKREEREARRREREQS